MTSTIAILCPKGITLAADLRITLTDPRTGEIINYIDDIEKLYPLGGNRFGIAYWGLGKFGGKKILEHLEYFEEKIFNKEDDVNDVASKLHHYLESAFSKLDRQMGFYVVGYIDKAPCLRHVFHMNWHSDGKFTNENCHEEYHLPNGNKVIYNIPKKYPVLFNGDNIVANALFNYAKKIQPYYDIVPDSLTLEESVDLAKLIIAVSIERLNFYFDQSARRQKIPATVGGGTSIATITVEKGFSWVK